MVGKSQIKLIRSLHQKKYRNQKGLFIVEGNKGVKEVLASNIKPYKVFTTDPASFENTKFEYDVISENDLKQMSTLKNPSSVLAIFHIPKAKQIDFNDWILVLDDVRDPGNLGTIIRLCDWFGIMHLVCSPQTVDCYNPKVLQATMGSISRVNICYTDIATFLKDCSLPIYGTFMNGISVYSEELPKKGVLIMGNEANGISSEIENIVSQKICIPQFGKKTTESLNVATAAGILLNEVRRG